LVKVGLGLHADDRHGQQKIVEKDSCK